MEPLLLLSKSMEGKNREIRRNYREKEAAQSAFGSIGKRADGQPV